MGLQSGFVLAVIVAAVLAAGHLGGGDEVGKRLFQLALAVTITFAAIGGTETFIRNPSFEDSGSILSSDFGSGDEEGQYEALEELADRSSLRRMIQFSAGIVALILGLSFIRRVPVTALAGALGGVLLVMFGAGVQGSGESSDPLSSFYAVFGTILSSAIGQPSRLVDISEFIVLCAGALALGLIGLRTWDMEQVQTTVSSAPEDIAPV